MRNSIFDVQYGTKAVYWRFQCKIFTVPKLQNVFAYFLPFVFDVSISCFYQWNSIRTNISENAHSSRFSKLVCDLLIIFDDTTLTYIRTKMCAYSAAMPRLLTTIYLICYKNLFCRPTMLMVMIKIHMQTGSWTYVFLHDEGVRQQ